jgi:hypothetical protein
VRNLEVSRNSLCVLLGDAVFDRLVQIRIVSRKTFWRIFGYKLKELVIGCLDENKAERFVGRRVSPESVPARMA